MRGRSAFATFVGFLAVVALIVVALVWMDVITFNNTEDQLNITIDKAKVESATEEALGKTGAALEKTGEKLQDEAQDAKNSK